MMGIGIKKREGFTLPLKLSGKRKKTQTGIG